MTERFASRISPGWRVFTAILAPVTGGLILMALVSRSIRIETADLGQIALFLSGAALTSWYIGWRWYGLPALGLRGGRPLYAGIGFAALGWIAFLVVRFVTVGVAVYGSNDSARTFVYTFLFEAFCVQLWIYGFFFRAAADWRGPLTAAVSSGLLFAGAAFLFFQESLVSSASYLLFLTTWGVFYGIIRLRTGGFLGTAIVQSLQSWTAWQVMQPYSPIDSSELRNLYLITGALLVVFIWRLWPKTEDDYRL